MVDVWHSHWSSEAILTEEISLEGTCLENIFSPGQLVNIKYEMVDIGYPSCEKYSLTCFRFAMFYFFYFFNVELTQVKNHVLQELLLLQNLLCFLFEQNYLELHNWKGNNDRFAVSNLSI